MITTTFRMKFRGNEKKFWWSLIEEAYVWPRISFSVAVVWMIRNDHAQYAPKLLMFAVFGICLYFYARRRMGPEREHESFGSVFFVIMMRIVGVSVAGPFYRWYLANMEEFKWLCIGSSILWLLFMGISLLPAMRKKMPTAENPNAKEPVHRLVLEAFAVPIHVAFGTPVVEWTVHGKGSVWGPLMATSVVCIIIYWAIFVKTQGWPQGSNPKEDDDDDNIISDEKLPEG
jgi:hypothetical protein